MICQPFRIALFHLAVAFEYQGQQIYFPDTSSSFVHTFFYVVFCGMKACYLIFAAVYAASFWLFIIAMIEVWILRITWQFYYALSQIPESRAIDLRTGEYQVSQIAYW